MIDRSAAKRRSEKGSIFFYIMLAVFLAAALTVSLTTGPRLSNVAKRINELSDLVEADIATIESAVVECAINYPSAVDLDADGDMDATDNPNVPFPVYNNLSNSGAGDPVGGIKCPGAPSAQRLLFNNQTGRTLRALGDTTKWTTYYFNSTTEGSFIRIKPFAENDIWADVAVRLEAKYSTCKAATTVGGAAPCGVACLYYWFKRNATSTTAVEAGCP